VAAVWLRFRAELRARWRATAVLALLVGIAGGAALAAIAGARRTDTAFTRLVHDTRAADVLVNPDLGAASKLDAAAVARLPMVTQAARVDGLAMVPADIRSAREADTFGVVLALGGGAGYRFDRPKVLEGEMPSPGRDEAVVNRVMARAQHLHVGQHFRVLSLTRADTERVDSGELSFDDAIALARQGRLGVHVSLRITGIAIAPNQIVVDQGFEEPQLLLAPGFLRRHPTTDAFYFGIPVRLRHGAGDVAAFRRAVERMVPDEAVEFQTLTATTSKVDRAVQPDVYALTVFAIVVALVGVLIVGQALVRQVHLDGAEAPALRALGMSRRELVAVALLRALTVAVLAAAVALVGAWLASWFTPTGPARTAEPHPGFAFDGLVLGLGALAVAVLVLVLTAVPAWRLARVASGAAADPSSSGASRVVGAAVRAGVPVPGVAGLRMALESGRGRTSVPVRTTIVGAVVSVAVVAAAFTFGASLDHLVGTPRLYGWNWDVHIHVGANDSSSPDDVARVAALRDQLAAVLDSSNAVQAWSEASLSRLTISSVGVPALGVKPGGTVSPTLVSGRLPRAGDEIALGARTERRLGVHTGGSVVADTVAGGRRRLRVVGRVVLPGLGTYPGADKTALGEGAVVTESALQDLGPNFQRFDLLVDFRAGASRAPVLQTVERTASAPGSGSVEVQVDGVQRPSDVISYEHVRSTPLVLAGVLALLGLATVTHALVSTVRRRRRELALLKTLGFTRAQVSAAVAWQATVIAVVALVVGLPLGVALGRWGWSVLAHDLGTLAEPIVPFFAVALAVPVVVVVVCNLVAFVPGRVAARFRPATVLRSE
jgi:ABC-type lipoprotein release transport system permease subunit